MMIRFMVQQSIEHFSIHGRNTSYTIVLVVTTYHLSIVSIDIHKIVDRKGIFVYGNFSVQIR
jgi:hypothetical protein